MRILGIDPGSRVTGFGVIETDGARHALVSYGVVRTKLTHSFPEKLKAIHQGILDVVDDCGPDQMVVESLFYATNVKSALKLGHVRGVALLAGVERGLPVHEYSPLEVKHSVVGYGRADKHQVQRMVAVLLTLEAPPESYDAADALAVALCHANQMRFHAKVRTSS
jgi:crossover junction endodeoxyribonuclease RuvC